MIRINLLPQAKRSVPSAGPGNAQVWYIVYAGASALFCLILGAIYFVFDSELAEKVKVNNALRNDIQTIQQRSARIEQVRTELARSHALETVVEEIKLRKTGPIRLMMELSRILSQDGGPTIDPAELERLRERNPLAGFNPGWNPRRLWLTAFEEKDDVAQIVTLRGQGRSNEDVAEFLRRIELSELFSEVRLTRTLVNEQQGRDARRLIDFELSCKVTY